MEVRMSEAAAHFRARLLGLCVLVLGTCIFVINGVNLGAAFMLFIGIISAIWHLGWFFIATVFSMVGILWVFRPHRALDTIDRNRQMPSA